MDEENYLALENQLTVLKTEGLELEQIKIFFAGIYNSCMKSGIFTLKNEK